MEAPHRVLRRSASNIRGTAISLRCVYVLRFPSSCLRAELNSTFKNLLSQFLWKSSLHPALTGTRKANTSPNHLPTTPHSSITRDLPPMTELVARGGWWVLWDATRAYCQFPFFSPAMFQGARAYGRVPPRKFSDPHPLLARQC